LLGLEVPTQLLARADGTYPSGLFAGSMLGHNGRRALTVPSRWITPPSVITPRSANKLKKAKQLSGTASASNKSRFMANVLSQASPFNRILACLDVRTTLSKKFNPRTICEAIAGPPERQFWRNLALRRPAACDRHPETSKRDGAYFVQFRTAGYF
jgi:hypothetical protein